MTLHLFLLAYRKSRPHPENNLIKIYGLGSLEASVARVDPKTGEKINKLRKSYEGQIKSFGLAGRNKATSHNSDTDGLNLLQLAQWPEEEFAIQRVSGKEVGRGLSDTTRAKLEKAVDLKPGKVPRNAEWENVLGHDKKATTEDVKTRKLEAHREEAQYSTASVKVQVNGHRVNGPTSAPEANRPRRMGKKRSYVDSSFEGYGEGFDDDVHDDDSSNEGSRRSSNSRKKRRKVIQFAPPAPALTANACTVFQPWPFLIPRNLWRHVPTEPA